MSLDFAACPHCLVSVAFQQDGTCPSCRRNRNDPADPTARLSAPRREVICPRPTSITVIAWFLIVAASINLATSIGNLNNPLVKDLMAKSPLPASAQFALLYLGLAVSLVSGIGMLMGHNWARWLYVIWSAFAFVVGLATSPMKLMLIPGVLVYVIIVLFLIRPVASRFFLAESAADAHEM